MYVMGQGNVNLVREAESNLLQEEAQTMFLAVDVVMQMEMGDAICAEEQEEYKSNLIKTIMKKIIMILVVLFVSISSASCQTYCYKHLYNVDTRGVKQKVNTHYVYVTFINRFSTCYSSDKDGNLQGATDGNVCQYKGKDKNGTLIYEAPVKEYGFSLSNRGMRDTRYFSADFSRMNYKNELLKDVIGVFERVSAPQEEEAPVDFY